MDSTELGELGRLCSGEVTICKAVLEAELGKESGLPPPRAFTAWRRSNQVGMTGTGSGTTTRGGAITSVA